MSTRTEHGMLVDLFLPLELADKIDAYRKKKNIYTMEFAVYMLLTEAIDAEEQQ